MEASSQAADSRALWPDTAVWLTLALTGVTLTGLCWLFAHTDRTLAMRARMLALFFGAFGVFLVAVFAVWRARLVGQELQLLRRVEGTAGQGADLLPYDLPRRLVWMIIIVGVALRLAVAPIRPATTSDIYRYLWEGRVVRAGMNPYRDPPSSPRLAHLRNWVWDIVPFKSVPAAYPPVAQYVFAAAGLIPGPPAIVLKLVLALFDVGTVLLLVSTLAAIKLPRSWVILYAWHPLAICELVARGHLDTIGIFFMALAFRLLLVGQDLRVLPQGWLVGRPCERSEQRRLLIAALSGAALSMSILAKGYAIIVAPFFILAARPRRGLFLVAMAATAALAYAPFASAGLGLFRGAAMYGRGWRGNSSVFALLDLTLSQVSSHHDAIARAICLVALVAWVAALLRKAMLASGDPAGTAGYALLALIGFFLLSPAVYPWYLAWTLPWLCLAAAETDRAGDTLRRGSEQALLPHVAWLILTGTIFGFYAHDLIGHHKEIWWITVSEYALPLLVALACAARRRPYNWNARATYTAI
jgi:hypothetical protein